MTSTRMQRLVAAAALCLGVAAGPPAASQDASSQMYEEALVRFEKDDIEGALLQLKELLSSDRGFLPAQILLARVFLSIGEGAAAEDAIATARRLGADPAIVWPLRAEAMFQQSKYKELVEFVPTSGLPRDVQAKLLVMRGRAHIEMSNLTAAERSFREASDLDPQSPDPHVGLAAVAFRAGDLSLAEVRAHGAVRLAPDDAEAWSMLGAVRHAQGAMREARSAYTRALELLPTHQDARAARAGLLVDFGELDAAADDIAYLRERYPFDPRGAYLEAVLRVKQGRRREAREALETAAALLSDLGVEVLARSPQLQLLAGVANYETGSFEVAQGHLQQYVDRYPEQIGPRKLLATIMISQGRGKEAIAVLDPVRERAGNDYQVQSLLGSAYMQLGRHDTALMHLEKAATLAPDSAGLRTRLAVSRMGAGHVEEGVEELEELFNEDPKRHREAGLRLAVALMKRDRAAEAVEVASLLVETSPDNLTVLNILGSALTRAGRPDEARDAYERALTIDPGFMPARMNLGKLAMIRGDVGEARERFEALLVDDPENVRALRALADLDEREGHVADSLRWLRKARDADPRNTGVVVDLVDALLRAGEVDEALQIAGEAESFAPENLAVLGVLARANVAKDRRDVARSVMVRMVRYAGFDARELYRVARLQLSIDAGDDAIYALGKALQGDPTYLPARLLLIDAQRRYGKLAQARDEALALVAKSPDLAVAHRLLGDVELSLGRVDAAVESHARAFELEPATGNLLKLYESRTLAGQVEEAHAMLAQWVAAHPDDRQARQVLADSHLARGDFEAARTEYERLLAADDTDADVLNNLANVLDRMGDGQALDYARRAHRLAAEDPAVNDTLGWMLVRRGEPTEGLKYLREAQSRAASSPEIRYHVARALVDLDRRGEARRELEEALGSGRPFEGVDQARALLEELR